MIFNIKRDKSIDALKGLSILCIVLLHYSNSILPTWSYVWISRFMITAFYFTSGWVTGLSNKNLTVKDLFSKRLRSLGIPYLWFTLLILSFDLLWLGLGYYDLKYILKDIYKAIMLRGIGTLWFLPALMGGELIALYLRRINKVYVWMIAAVVTLLFLFLYDKWFDKYRNIDELHQIIDVPLGTIANILRAWPVIIMGFIISRNFATKIRLLSPLNILLWGAIIATTSIFTCDYFIDLNVFKWFVSPILGPLGLLLLLKGMVKLKLTDFLTYWGRNSLIVMVTHYSIIQVVCETVCTQLLHRPFEGSITLLFFVLTIMIEYPIIYFFNYKASFMLGK